MPMSGRVTAACDGIPIMSDGDTPIIRTSDGERPGIKGDETDIVVVNRLMAALTGKSLVQFRMG